MATITKRLLSGMTNSTPINITATQGVSSTLIHLGSTSTADIDELYIWASNETTGANRIIIEFGTSGTSNDITIPLAPLSGPELIIPGWPILGAATGREINALVGSQDGSASGALPTFIKVHGYVNRINQS